jgi:hypothetical protein
MTWELEVQVLTQRAVSLVGVHVEVVLEVSTIITDMQIFENRGSMTDRGYFFVMRKNQALLKNRE